MPGSSRTSGFNYSALRKGLRLLVNEPEQMSDTPTDVSYLHKVGKERGRSGGSFHCCQSASVGSQLWSTLICCQILLLSVSLCRQQMELCI
jgi:hypothetical protein